MKLLRRDERSSSESVFREANGDIPGERTDFEVVEGVEEESLEDEEESFNVLETAEGDLDPKMSEMEWSEGDKALFSGLGLARLILPAVSSSLSVVVLARQENPEAIFDFSPDDNDGFGGGRGDRRSTSGEDIFFESSAAVVFRPNREDKPLDGGVPVRSSLDEFLLALLLNISLLIELIDPPLG